MLQTPRPAETTPGRSTEAGAGLLLGAVVVVCLRPSSVKQMLSDLGASSERSRPLWISIAAGVPISTYAGALPEGTRIIRSMPNTPALVGAGATAFCAGRRWRRPRRPA